MAGVAGPSLPPTKLQSASIGNQAAVTPSNSSARPPLSRAISYLPQTCSLLSRKTPACSASLPTRPFRISSCGNSLDPQSARSHQHVSRQCRRRCVAAAIAEDSSTAAWDGWQVQDESHLQSPGREESREKTLRVFISTGDVSGDMHATGLVHELRKQAQAAGHQLTVCALGGGGIQEAGATLVGDNRGLSSIGLLEALPLVLPTLRLQAQARAFLQNQPPDVVVLIDYPGVNIPFGRYLKHQFGCPVVCYVPPNEWLWNEARTPALCAMADAILCTYPQEAGYFHGAGGSVQLVGHPLLDAVASKPDRTAARAALGVGARTLVVVLLPASRAQEVRHVWPVLARAAHAVQQEWASSGNRPLRFYIPVVSSDLEDEIRHSLQSYPLEATIWKGDSHTVLAAADLALTKSGTVNLELALFQVPQVVVYRIDAVTAWLARTLFHFNVPHISLVNLILEEPLVPEFIQEAARPEDVAAAALGLLRNQHGARDAVLDGYRRLSDRLGGPGAAGRAAATILQMMTMNAKRTEVD